MPTQQAVSAAPDSPSPSLPDPGWTTRLANVVLGTDNLQRLTLQLLGLAALVTATVVVLLAYAATIGVADVHQVGVLSALFFLFMLVFYTAIRSGLNKRFADPTLAMPQTIILDRQGRIRATMAGEADWSSPQARALIDAVLAEGGLPPPA